MSNNTGSRRYVGFNERYFGRPSAPGNKQDAHGDAPAPAPPAPAVPTVYLTDPDVTLWHGDVLDTLRDMPDGSVDCVITSPPYWGLRDYGTGGWEGGDPDCDHPHPKAGDVERNLATSTLVGTGQSHANNGPRDVCGKCGATRQDQQLGLEATPDLFVARMVDVFREVRRVLAAHGTCWVNMGDGYNANQGAGFNGQKRQDHANRHTVMPRPPGLKQKDLVGMPWMLAFALRADGWYLRSDIVWSKPNPMPESVTDRPTKAHEYVFLLTKQPRYFFDQEAVRERFTDPREGGEGFRWGSNRYTNQTVAQSNHATTDAAQGTMVNGANPAGRNIRSVWEIATQPYPEAHFACVDAETEALTPTGWKRHADLREGDEIATYDPDTDSCRFAPATFHRYDYDGDLVTIEKRDSSQRLTPNHRCYVRRRSGWTGVVRADELKPGMDVLTCAPLHVDESLGIGMDHAALLGWYTAEGSRHHDGYVSIYQSQSANPQHVETIRDLLAGVGAMVRERTRYRTVLGRGLEMESVEVEFAVSGTVGRWLEDCGKALDTGAINLPRDEAQALLDALIDGDGHRRADGRACIVQKDKAVIDRMQMLALRLGYRAVVSQRKDGQHVLYLTRGRWLTLRSSDGKHTPIGREHYRGVVWCPNVATGLWLARRNGRPFVTGNTYPEELVRRCLLAGCPEWVCRVCGKPRERIVELTPEYRALLDSGKAWRTGEGKPDPYTNRQPKDHPAQVPTKNVTLGWSDCGHANYRPGLVLDPFVGSGTTAHVARKHGRHAIGIDLNADYLALAAKRLQQQSLFAEGIA